MRQQPPFLRGAWNPNTVFFAIKPACLAARTDVGAPRCFELDASVTVARIQEPYKTRLT